MTSKPDCTTKEMVETVVEDSPETEPTEEHLVLANHLILQRIFRCLSLSELKGVRLVCRRWSVEAAKGFRATTVIYLESPKVSEAEGREHLEELGSFVQTHLLLHTLTLSFLIHSWHHKIVQDTLDPWMDPRTEPYYTQQNNISTETAEKVLDYLGGTGEGVTELRLEMMLLDEEDSRLLSQVLTRLPKLKRLSLDIIRFGSAGMSPLTTVPTSLHTLEIRFHEKPKVNRTTLSLVPLTHFLTSFNNITFLDLDWNLLNLCPDETYRTLCLHAISDICTEDPKAFNKLKGLKTNTVIGLFPVRGNKEESKHLIFFPKSLSHLYLEIQQGGEDGLILVERILQRHAPTLEVLDLIWHPIAMFDSQIHVNFPYLPKLTTLVLGLASAAPENWTIEGLDAFNLRSLFQFQGALEVTLPSLHTLSILFEEESNEIWSLIFPPAPQPDGAADAGKQLEFRQIRTLIISMTVDCDFPELLRLHQIFPCLQMLRHVRVERDQVFGCEHKAPFGLSLDSLSENSENLGPVRRWKVSAKVDWWDESWSLATRRHNQLVPLDCKWFDYEL